MFYFISARKGGPKPIHTSTFVWVFLRIGTLVGVGFNGNQKEQMMFVPYFGPFLATRVEFQHRSRLQGVNWVGVSDSAVPDHSLHAFWSTRAAMETVPPVARSFCRKCGLSRSVRRYGAAGLHCGGWLFASEASAPGAWRPVRSFFCFRFLCFSLF